MSLLTEMTLSGNALSGSLPPRFAAIPRLDISNNLFLCGAIPSMGGNVTLVAERTSLGRDCVSIGQSPRMSGTLGLILGEADVAPQLRCSLWMAFSLPRSLPMQTV